MGVSKNWKKIVVGIKLFIMQREREREKEKGENAMLMFQEMMERT